MNDSLIYVRRSYVKVGAPDISDQDQEAAIRRLFPDDAQVGIIRDSYDEDDPESKRKHSGASENRAGYQELIALVRRGGVKRVGVYDLSRLHRDTRAMLNLKHELDLQGIHLVVADMPNSLFETAAGRFQFGIMCMGAQYQRDLDAEKGRRRAEYVYQSGGHNGLDPLGYRTMRASYPKGEIVRPRNLEIIEAEAEVVRRIFRKLVTTSFAQIAGALNAEHVLDRLWTVDAIKDVWRRRRFYVGFATWKRGQDERPGLHPPILDEATYRGAEIGVAMRRRAGRPNLPHRTYLLAGRAKCRCGAGMRGNATVNRGYPERRYYRCGLGCGQPSAAADRVEQTVLDAVRTAALPARAIQAARDELARRLHVDTTSGLSDKRRQRLTTALGQIRKLHMWGDLTDAEYVAERNQLQAQLAEVPNTDKLVQFDSHRKVVLSLAQSLDKAGPAKTKELLSLLVERVTIDGGKADPEQIIWTPAARPFFEHTDSRFGLERPRRESNPRRRP